MIRTVWDPLFGIDLIPIGIVSVILVIVALSLLMFAVIPSNASDNPRPWKRFLENHSDGK